VTNPASRHGRAQSGASRAMRTWRSIEILAEVDGVLVSIPALHSEDLVPVKMLPRTDAGAKS